MIDIDRINAPIRYENLNGGCELFPHIYSALPRESVVAVERLELRDDGSFEPLSVERRLVVVRRTKPDGTIEELWLVTDRFDLPAELIALVYRYRWTVELFFRWFKCILGCRHLLANDVNGVAIQCYVALIASRQSLFGQKQGRNGWLR